jgi:hypothetical protein
MQTSRATAVAVGFLALTAAVVVATPGRAVMTPKLRGVYAPPPERMKDPPAPAEVIAGRGTSAGGVITFGPYISRQVNVDGAGNNILGDAANEPTIAINPLNPKQIAIGWRQFDTIVSDFRQAGRAYSTDGGAAWTFPGSLDPGRFRSDPVLGFDGFGNFYYSSLARPFVDPSSFEVHVFKSTNGGLTWSSPVYAFGGDKQWLVADDRASGLGAGNLYQAWTSFYSCCGSTNFTRSTDGGGSFQSPLDLPDPRMMWGTLDTDSNGVLYLGGASTDQSTHLLTKSMNAWDPAASPVLDAPRMVDLDGFTGGFGGLDGPNPVGLLGQVWIAAHPAKLGHLYMLSSVIRFTDPTDVMFSRSVDGGATWSPPIRVNDDVEGNGAWQWFGTMSVAPNGRIDVIWNDTRSTGEANRSAVYYSYSLDEGQSWSFNEQVSPVFNSHLGFPQQAKIGDYYHMISDNGGANLAYSATFNGEQDVYFLRIRQDCNGNTIDDDCETACGPEGTRCGFLGCGESADCNGNFIPDECEFDDDCNKNSQRDICEIGSDPALDCNASRILDACEDSRDCNGNLHPDICDIFVHGDCNGNVFPDDCDIDVLEFPDRNENRVPDECQGACCGCFGCTTAGEDECFFFNGTFGGFGTICADDACESPIAGNDDCASAMELPSSPLVFVDFYNLCASTDGPASVSCPAAQPFEADLWYTYTAPCTGMVRFKTCHLTNFDAMLAVYGSGGACACPDSNDSLLECGDDTCGFGGGPAFVDVPATAGACYTIRVGGWDGETGNGELTVSCYPTDLNKDGVTNLADFAYFQVCFGRFCPLADFEADNAVDLDDYRVFFAALAK